MNRYEFRFKGQLCFVSDEGRRVALAVPLIGEQRREDVAAAEILRLAEREKVLSEAAGALLEVLGPLATLIEPAQALRALLEE